MPSTSLLCLAALLRRLAALRTPVLLLHTPLVLWFLHSLRPSLPRPLLPCTLRSPLLLFGAIKRCAALRAASFLPSLSRVPPLQATQICQAELSASLAPFETIQPPFPPFLRRMLARLGSVRIHSNIELTLFRLSILCWPPWPPPSFNFFFSLIPF